MPIREFQCEECDELTEAILTQTEDKQLRECGDECCTPACESCGCPFTKLVISAPAPPQFGGADGKARTAKNVKKRNDDHFKSKKGQDEHRDNVKAAHKRLGLPS